MAEQEHHYAVQVKWTGNRGKGTSGYRDYERDYTISTSGKADIAGSSDPAFRGDASRWNPEDLLVASLSACHKLWYLHFCSVNGIIVEDYVDNAEGTLVMEKDGAGQFSEVVLKPVITISKGDPARADELHHDAHDKCFIARSVNFPIRVEGTVKMV
ncbi:peroxiredoxin [Agrobacterium salinitolerans]|uniref:OsmC family protein n=1 Tax=Agrobacterium salinitolerans TaxID=1183413 RepID=UPI00098F156E|nr:OsmC family protein [Agrobacterium salinitolerans]OOO26955.1 peroxiredoxin [Agrobacterium salinitolerans]PNQ25118.1 OsmC family peroxiredoxin [Rhizobium sp. YIC5082]